FHAAMPEEAWRYALPSTPETQCLRRYGFHGISYQGLTRQLQVLSGAPSPQRLLALHLGNGASLCAILEGRSVATSMGYSPLDGLTMGTRCGSIGGGAVLALAAAVGVERAARILNHESGLLGLGGASDMRTLAASDTPEARFAIQHFCYWAVRHAGSAIAAMGGLDAIAFTGGIGEHAAGVRSEIVKGLGFLGAAIDPAANAASQARLHPEGAAVGVWIIPAREEETMAAEALRLLG
ncbi:MAG: acetate kinase, partial [Rhodobacteraceae bacterium]|nr:acetate kinase [Paracoccaceae bacterium]